MNALRLAVNIGLYKCAWFACVLSAAAQRPYIGIAVAAAELATAWGPGARPAGPVDAALDAALDTARSAGGRATCR
mgnify:CR=1 FL=1